MRHNKKGTHLGRTTSHKKAMTKNMVASLFEHKSIKTTFAKAKDTKIYAERLITLGKSGSLHHRRLAFKFLQSKEAVKTLFDEIGPACKVRDGGYTRIIKLGFRKGDAASICMLELVDFSSYSAEKRKLKSEKSEQKQEKKKELSKASATE